ncbi:MAG: leucine-rich repeat protein [Ruminococcus sp.]|nr:leucine-rich repeat protein [Ruminococcus sp.]
MKKRFIAGIAAAAMLLGSTGAVLPEGVISSHILYADAGFEENGTQYGDFWGIVKNNKMIITDYTGTSSAVSIPSTLGGYTVTALGDSDNYFPFMSNKSVTSVTIPNTVTTLGEGAFSSCTSLQSVTLPSSLTEIADSLFAGCTSLKTINIPSTVTSIGPYAFTGCSSLASATLPAGLTSIGNYAFLGCTSLMELTLGKNVAISSTGYAVGYKASGASYVAIDGFVLKCYSNTSGSQYAFNSKPQLTYQLIDLPNHTHDFDDGVQTVEPACNHVGTMLYTCKTCGYSYKETIAKTAHNYVSTTYPPTETSQGYIYYECSYCRDHYTVYLANTSLEFATVTGVNASYNYTGSAIKPEPVVTMDGKTLKKGTDYSVTYSNNVNAGTATIKITGNGTYTNSKYVTFQIVNNTVVKKDINGAVVTISNCNYNGSAQTPEPTVKYNGTTLVKGTDYTVSYSNNVNAGTATVTLTGKGNYTGTKNATFTINALSLANAAISVSSVTYNGSAQTPAPTVTLSGKTLTKGTDYTVSYTNNTNAGTATMTITGKGNYTGTRNVNFAINKLNLSSATVTAAGATYTGSAITPAPTVKVGSTTVSSSNYTVTYSDNVNAGTATVTVTGKNNCTGTKSGTFTISKINLSNASITVANMAYTGSQVKPVPTVTYGGKTVAASNYTVAYSNNINPGTATVTVTGKGNYTGSKSATFTITRNTTDISGAAITVSGVTYNGSAQTPAPTVKLGGTALVKDTDYTVSYTNNVNAGTATVTVTGKGNYTGSKSANFTIAKANLSSAAVTVSNCTYTGAAQTPAPTVKLGSKTLVKDTDYTVSYTNNVNAGTATVTVTGKGNYTGSKSASFTITRASGARIPGDANDDKQVNIMDVLVIRQHLAGWNVSINLSNANVNGDNNVNIQDVLVIRQNLAGWNVPLV